jgi:hypothetical protein
MSEIDLTPEETATMIDYARRKYAEERWPLSPELRAVREIVEKLRGKPRVPPMEIRPHEPSLHLLKQKRGR